MYGKSRDDSLPGWGELISLYLVSAYLGKGHGKELMDAVLADFSRRGIRDVYLWALEGNARARKFYEAYGFTCNYDEYHTEIAGMPLTDLRYVIHLGEGGIDG